MHQEGFFSSFPLVLTKKNVILGPQNAIFGHFLGYYYAIFVKMVVEMVDLRESSFSVELSEWAEKLGTFLNPRQKYFPNFWGRFEQPNKSYEQYTAKVGTKCHKKQPKILG